MKKEQKLGGVEDFFLIVWNEKMTTSILGDADALLCSFDGRAKERDFQKNFCELGSIVLSANSKNFDKINHLETFKEGCSFFDRNSLHVKTIQVAILLFLAQKEDKFIGDTLLHVKKIYENGIFKSSHFEALSAVLSQPKPLEPQPIQNLQSTQKAPKTYKEYVNFFEEHLKSLELVLESKYLKKRVNALKEKLNNTSFSIGITGVMNAGKSTMLNALLGKEILGTSVVPETANLTLIKYAKKPYAKVNFWNAFEWEEIEKSAKYLPSIEKFIQDTKEGFGDELANFIQEETKTQEVDIGKLPLYTSAKLSDLKCNLVKSVELFTDLDFVKDGVSIVDTPGLDDIVIQREEITKKYLSDCDIMVHLMNANQSATQKDVEFIIDSLTYQHISRLLIVITRIDTITSQELEEVISYTKKSIKKRLKEANKEASFDKIIEKIKFLPIAGKLALMHRVGKEDEAIKEGYSLEKTGILDIESYLADVLFGKGSQKATLLVDGAKKEIAFIIKEALGSFGNEEKNLSTTAKDLKKVYEAKSAKNATNFKELEKIENTIAEAKKELESFFTTLANFLKIKLDKLRAVVATRVVDDCSYEARKNKTKPSQMRIFTMIETTMKDGIVDLVRDYRYEFYKKIESKLEDIAQVSALFEALEKGSATFDTKEFFEANFGKSFLDDSYMVVNQRAYKVVDSTKRGDTEKINTQLEIIFKEAMKSTLGKLYQNIDGVNAVLLEEFLQKVKEPIENLKFQMKEEEQELLSQILVLEGDEQKVKKRLEEILEKKEKLLFLEEAIN